MVDKDTQKLNVYQSEIIAKEYNNRWRGVDGRKRNARKASAIFLAYDKLQDFYSDNTFRNVLDVPCGTGRFSNLLKEKGITTIGLDLSLTMIEEAKLAHKDEHYLCGDLKKLPFQDNSFDLAMCIRMFHLVSDPELRIQLLSELRRVCKYGAIIDYRHCHTIRIMGRKLRYKMGLYKEWPNNPSIKQIYSELAQSGWNPIGKIQVHYAPLLSDKLIFPVVPNDVKSNTPN